MKKILMGLLVLKTSLACYSQPKFTLSGTAGVTYDGYGLNTTPSGYGFYTPRRPWNLVRFNFAPTFGFGGFKLPINLNFSPMRNNFGSAPFGFGSLPGFPKQTFGQWLSNPANSFGINPTYKWAELQLGTQYLKYSDLSTGDLAAFGYGFSLKPGRFRFKFFRGTSQQSFQPFTSVTPVFVGVYKRTLTMAHIGLEKDDVYSAGFNIVKGKDDATSIAVPVIGTPSTPTPEDNLIIGFATRFKTSNGWYGQSEWATTFSSRNNTAAGPSPLVKDFLPLLHTNGTSYRDHALQAGFGKKGKGWDVGASMKWLGAGYHTMGYPFVQNDRLEYTANTRFSAWKNKVNVTASIGQRFGNWSHALSTPRTKQIIANANIFAQVNDHLSINASYNNFGFNAPSTSGGIKNVGNDLGISPTYTWITKRMSHLLSLNYNWSSYTETYIPPPYITTNNTHTALLVYAPAFFDKPNLSPDFTVMYFRNGSSLPSELSILSASSSLAWSIPKKKLRLRGQLMYSRTTISPNTASNNVMATLGADFKLTKKLAWNTSMTANFNKYGNELLPQPVLLGASYLESTLHTSLQYRFGK